MRLTNSFAVADRQQQLGSMARDNAGFVPRPVTVQRKSVRRLSSDPGRSDYFGKFRVWPFCFGLCEHKIRPCQAHLPVPLARIRCVLGLLFASCSSGSIFLDVGCHRFRPCSMPIPMSAIKPQMRAFAYISDSIDTRGVTNLPSPQRELQFGDTRPKGVLPLDLHVGPKPYAHRVNEIDTRPAQGQGNFSSRTVSCPKLPTLDFDDAAFRNTASA
jgi:hypothetical protein